MNRKTLMLVAFIPALSLAGLSACNRDAEKGSGFVTAAPAPVENRGTIPAEPVPGAVSATESVGTTVPNPAPGSQGVEYAEVIRVKAVTVDRPVSGTVTDVRELVQESVQPAEVCEDVVVEERLPERDGNVGGTVAGAVVGGALGNQVGGGDGRKLATLAGAIAGGYAGRAIDRKQENGKVVSRTEQQCRTEQQSSATVTGYEVSFRRPDGSTGTRELENAPEIGSRVDAGSTSKTIGYDVTYRYEGEQTTVRMDRRPGERLPVIDGRVVLDSRPVSKG